MRKLLEVAALCAAIVLMLTALNAWNTTDPRSTQQQFKDDCAAKGGAYLYTHQTGHTCLTK